MKKKLIAIIVLLVLIIGGSWYIVWQRTNSGLTKQTIKNSGQTPKNTQPFTINLQTNRHFAVGQPQTLTFTVHDQNGKLFKSFDTSDEEILRMYVIRKDRTNFQQAHVGYNPKTGIFSVNNLVFPVDGPYRLFAQFTPVSAKKDVEGTEIAEAPYIDITAGDIKHYVAVTPIAAKVIASTNGFDTNIFFAPSDDSPGVPPVNYFIANNEDTVAIEINKAGAPVKDLQNYRGSVGRIAAFGPNLEFSTANSEPLDNNQQTGLLIFNLKFGNPGLYRLFMQVESSNKFSTFDYNVTAQALQKVAPKTGGHQ